MAGGVYPQQSLQTFGLELVVIVHMINFLFLQDVAHLPSHLIFAYKNY